MPRDPAPEVRQQARNDAVAAFCHPLHIVEISEAYKQAVYAAEP